MRLVSSEAGIELEILNLDTTKADMWAGFYGSWAAPTEDFVLTGES